MNRTLTAILVGAATLLFPVACYLTMARLHIDHLDLRGQQFVVLIVWGMLDLAVLGPVVVISMIPAFARFAFGPPEFRGRWMTLQLLAWIFTVFIAAAGLGYWMGERGRELGESLVFHAVPTVAAAFAGYLAAMSMMPAGFFEKDAMGQVVMKFLGVSSTGSVPKVCILAAIAVTAIAVLMWWVPANTFQT